MQYSMLCNKQNCCVLLFGLCLEMISGSSVFAGPYLCMEVFSDNIAIITKNVTTKKVCTTS
jgi:hypothetical protein